MLKMLPPGERVYKKERDRRDERWRGDLVAEKLNPPEKKAAARRGKYT